ncbi:MAG: YdeI/OmpD-associated family protein [Myxococcales bacterium]|nr:YdeI/OmpD-associated family protein [Myxococcales bacterium]
MATPPRSRDTSTTRRKAATTTPGRTAKVDRGDPVLALPSAEKWDAWLRANHGRSAGVLLRIPKRSAGNTLTYAAALEVALTWGWIDSQKQALDDVAWLQRFTPRTPRSPWSKINRAKAEALIASGRMEAPGLAEVDRAKRDGRWERAYESAKTSTIPDDLADALSRNDRARAFFETLDAANRYAILYRVTTAKRAETRAKRIATFVAMCAAHKTLHPPRTRARAKPIPARKPSMHR